MENLTQKIQLISLVILLSGLIYLLILLIQLIKGCRIHKFSFKNLYNYIGGALILLPLIIFLYYLPIALYGDNFWIQKTLSYEVMQKSIISFGGVIFAFYFFIRTTIFFPHVNKSYNIISLLLPISIVPGLSNSLIVMIISQSVNEHIDFKYLLLFFVLATYFFIISIRISKRITANLGAHVAHEFTMKVLNNVFRFSYRKFEKVESGKIYTILNDDIGSIFYFSQVGVHIFTHLTTGILVFVYLFILNTYNTLVLIGAIVFIYILWGLLGGTLTKAWRLARIKREDFITLVVGLINGFKELILHHIQRTEYKTDIEDKSDKFYKSQLHATYIDINKTLLSEISFIVAVCISCLVMPFVLNMNKELTTTYIIATLFLWGPFNNVLSGIPTIINAKISWQRIKDFLRNAEKDEYFPGYNNNNEVKISAVDSLTVKEVYFNYENNDNQSDTPYSIGPINFKANKGEIIFIIGGNGSGKTTFLKLLVGLYTPTSGKIQINGENVDSEILGEYFSVIYSDFYLFKKIYGINPNRLDQVNEWLDMFDLSNKVQIKDGAYSTIALSKGQCKRLAILKSYLEDRPIYFFDECAADLDPDFKNFFYNDLLKTMRNEGKLLIVITHDDKYFNIADVIYKMDMGKISVLNKENNSSIY